MNTKSIQGFRFNFKTKIKIADSDTLYDESFVGTYHRDSQGKILKKGFFELYHGYKPEGEDRFIRGFLEMAEDDQAIYEFIQNAVDCDSTNFSIFYNDDYFLAINNGKPFEQDEILSILNIGQSSGKRSSDKIGRFGIGFKLVHRLVGKNEGLNELFNQYKGPVLFSWSQKDHFEALLKGEQITPIRYNIKEPKTWWNSPWLLKILLTNFPVEIDEKVKNLRYEEFIPFKKNEIVKLKEFLNECINKHRGKLDLSEFNQGSLFFLELGEGKRSFFDKSSQNLKSGIKFSMNMLGKLKKIFINEDAITQQELNLEHFEIEKESEVFQRIEPDYPDFNIKISVGFPKITESYLLKEAPNFYKYFPLGSEVHGFRFIVHSDAFNIESNRRELHNSYKNRILLPEVANCLIKKLDSYQSGENRKHFLNIYANLLLSDKPKGQDKEWLNEYFWDFVENYIRTNIPTWGDGFSIEPRNVKIRKTKIKFNLTRLGFNNIQWFWYDSQEPLPFLVNVVDEIVSKASDKLGLESWDLTHIIEKAEIDELNTWIEKTTDENYQLFLKELGAKSYLRPETIAKLQKLKFLHFSDNKFYSIEDVAASDDLLICFDKVHNIRPILIDLGFSISSLNISSYKELHTKLRDSLESDVQVYKKIASISAQNANLLQPKQKQRLFENLISEVTKFDGVGKETLKELILFANNLGETLPIEKLLSPKLSLTPWLEPYQIDGTEYFSALDSYLMPQSSIYQEIIYPEGNFKAIIGHIEPEQVELFYKQITEYYSLADNAKGFNSHPFVFADSEFVGIDKIFYNVKLKGVKNYSDFQAIIQKISQNKLPKKTLLSHFDDDQTPFYIKVGENITDLPLEGAYTQVEVSEILNFCVLNKESFFKEYWIEQENDSYKIHKETKGQFYTLNHDLAVILSETDDFRQLPKGLYIPELNTIGLQTETEALLKQAVMSGFSDARLMRLLKKSDSADLKKYAISQIKRLDIQSGTEYGKSAFEHLAIEIFIDQYKEDKEQTEYFRDKIFINGINVKEFSFRDKVTIKTDQKESPEFSLATLIADYEGSSDLVTSVINQFKGLRKDLDLIFKTEEKQPARVYDELRKGQLKIVNPEQGVFLMIYANLRNDSGVLNGFDFSAVQASEILNGLFEKGFGNILKQSVLPDFKVKEWILPNKYAYGSEITPKWVTNWLENVKTIEKLAYLSSIGLRSENSDVVQLRKALILESDIDTEVLLANLKTDTITLSNTLFWFFSKNSIVSIDTKQVGILKNLYFKQPYHAQLPIPIIKNARKSEIELIINDNCQFYTGEVDTAFFEKIFDILTQKSYFYLCDILSETWLKSLNPTKISLEEAVNIEKLRISEKWEMPHLKRWEEIHNKSVFLYDGQIPYQTKFLGEVIDEFENGDIYPIENQIFINKAADCETLFLAALSSEEKASYFQAFHSEKSEPLVAIHFAEEQKEIQKFMEGRSIEELKELISLGLMVKNYSKPEEAEDRSNNTVFRTEINSGLKAEIIVNEYLISSFGKERVRWVSEKNTGAKYGTKYDFEVLMQDLQNVMYYIDAKSTTTSNESEEIDIILRNSEWKFMIASEKDKYLIAKVFNANNPTLDDIVFLKMGIEEL